MVQKIVHVSGCVSVSRGGRGRGTGSGEGGAGMQRRQTVVGEQGDVYRGVHCCSEFFAMFLMFEVLEIVGTPCEGGAGRTQPATPTHFPDSERLPGLASVCAHEEVLAASVSVRRSTHKSGGLLRVTHRSSARAGVQGPGLQTHSTNRVNFPPAPGVISRCELEV